MASSERSTELVHVYAATPFRMRNVPLVNEDGKFRVGTYQRCVAKKGLLDSLKWDIYMVQTNMIPAIIHKAYLVGMS